MKPSVKSSVIGLRLRLEAIVADTTHLHFLDQVELAPTFGRVTLATSNHVFNPLDPNLKRWKTDRVGIDTNMSTALVYEMTQDGIFSACFGSCTKSLSSLVWQQGQIREFCVSHPRLLRQGGYNTFFLFETEGVLFVAGVYASGKNLSIRVHDFRSTFIWHAVYRHRLVVPE